MHEKLRFTKKDIKEKTFPQLFAGKLRSKKGMSAMDMLREAGLRL